GCGERGTILHCWRECKLVQPLWKTGKFRKLKIELPYDPEIALLGIYPKDTKILIRGGTPVPTFIAALSTIAELWKEPKCSWTDEWIERCGTHTHTHTHTHTQTHVRACTECYSAIKKNEILRFAKTWMELECIVLSE
ncbi:LORF2 protein, partial [Crocuta crocuta]